MVCFLCFPDAILHHFRRQQRLFVDSVDEQASVVLRSVTELMTLALSWKIPTSVTI